jgi:hypothetical protein
MIHNYNINLQVENETGNNQTFSECIICENGLISSDDNAAFLEVTKDYMEEPMPEAEDTFNGHFVGVKGSGEQSVEKIDLPISIQTDGGVGINNNSETPEKIELEEDKTTVLIPNDFDWERFFIFNKHVFGFNYEKNQSSALKIYQQYKMLYPNLPYKDNHIDLLIYSGGKTGTSSLVISFFQAGCHRIHALQRNCFLEGVTSISSIIKQPRPHKLIIVSSYREPISRHISGYFQDITAFTGVPVEELRSWPISKLIDNFFSVEWELSEYQPFSENDSEYFDNINIFSKPFNKEEGYQTYETDRVKVIQLSFARIKNWEYILQKETPYSNLVMLHWNNTEEKNIAGIYRNFLEALVIPKNQLDGLFERNQKYLEYFLYDHEILALKDKWYSRLAS